jgi:hypothetical protein
MSTLSRSRTSRIKSGYSAKAACGHEAKPKSSAARRIFCINIPSSIQEPTGFAINATKINKAGHVKTPHMLLKTILLTSGK